jgi:hypothetical protein
LNLIGASFGAPPEDVPTTAIGWPIVPSLVMAVAGLLVLISSQFCDQDLDAGPTGLMASVGDYHPMEPSIGSLFRIKYPDDWTDAECYDFDWTVLKTQANRFDKINYDAIPY